MAADGGGTASPAKPTERVARAADCVKPDPSGKGDRAPLSLDDPSSRRRARGFGPASPPAPPSRGEADAVVREVTAGSVNLDELVKAETIDAVLKEIKNGHAGDKAQTEKPPAAAAAKRIKAARGI
jgi:hypothetical protein